MSQRYLACDESSLDPVTGVCSAEVWVEHPSWLDALPTVDQAETVGAAFFVSLVTLAVVKRLIKPPSFQE